MIGVLLGSRARAHVMVSKLLVITQDGTYLFYYLQKKIFPKILMRAHENHRASLQL